jgi:hypothetical protein
MPEISQTCFTDATEDQQNFNIYSAIANLQGFQIPEYDEIDISYYGSTNNISSVVYSKLGSPVATLTLTYQIQPPLVDDENLVNITIA